MSTVQRGFTAKGGTKICEECVKFMSEVLQRRLTLQALEFIKKHDEEVNRKENRLKFGLYY